MKTIIIQYGIGYGLHEMDIQVEETATPESIEEEAFQAVCERLDWAWKEEEK